jgi:hypothetical protein
LPAIYEVPVILGLRAAVFPALSYTSQEEECSAENSVRDLLVDQTDSRTNPRTV